MTADQYNQCVDLYADRIYRFVLKHLGRVAEAKDIVQSSFEILWRNHERVEFQRSRSYLFQVAYRLLLKSFEQTQVVELTDDLELTAREQPLGLREALDVALARLSPVQKALVLLRDYEGYRYDEIAAITGLSEAQVKVYLFRARKKLKDFLVSLHHVV
ncbi:MAG: sigma-70 family RNA polymerase sigma factor [Chitinophagales bacterium]|nr:sigma-70 family RNA polymerase sigma factor [Chitinophagales bacterium]MDW8427989.1 sigma-70 family RNA polymerase sigma factor [Chitinophagales bacterium]